MTPSLSIVIPVYNVAPYLRECLDSVLAQTFTDWEAICVDDGSTDGSGTILDEYAARDTRFRIIHQGNAGVSIAREVGLSNARGEYIGWLDSDDTIASTHFAGLISLAREKDADLCWSNFYKDTDGNIVIVRQDSQEVSRVLLANLLLGKVWGSLWDKVFRRSFIEKYHVNFSHGKCEIMEDIFFLSEFLSHNPTVTHIDKATYYYKIRNGSLSNQGCTREWWMKAINASNAIYSNLFGRCEKRLLQYRLARLKYMMLLEKNVTNSMFYSYHPEISVLPRDIAPILWRIAFAVATYKMRSLVLMTLAVSIRLKHFYRKALSR